MKPIIFLVTVAFFFAAYTVYPDTNAGTGNQSGVTIPTSPEAHNLISQLLKEYNKINPEASIDILPQSQSGVINQLFFIPEESLKNAAKQSLWKITVARDAVVPVMNRENPAIREITTRGITSGEFARLFSAVQKPVWEKWISGGNNRVVNLYLPAEEKVRMKLASFAGTDPGSLSGKSVQSPQEMINAIRTDPDAIGFCRLSDLTDPATGSYYGQIAVIPLDKNQNGRIDFFEDIYVSRESLIRGIWIGKYPKSLYSDILAVAPSRPAGSRELAFLEWVVSDGQKYLNSAGYSEINSLQAENAAQALVPAVTIISAPEAASSSTAWVLIFATLIIAAVLISPILLVNRKKRTIHAEDFHVSPGFSEASLSAPAGMFFDKTHTWAFLEKDGRVRIGMDDFMQHVTGPLSRVIMKYPGEIIRKGDKVLTIIQDGKHLELCAPVSGVIRENNPKLLSDCTPVNSTPYSDGWIYLVEPRNWLKEILFLLPGKQYSEWIKDEFTRLKDFFASLAQKNNLVYAHVVLQDGGEISDHVLTDLGPEVWEEFQNYFLDLPK